MQCAVTEEVDSIGSVLAEKVGTQRYEIWFKNSTRMSLSGGYLKIAVPNLFIAHWIERNFSSDICYAAKTITGSVPKLTFTIEPELASPQKRPLTGGAAGQDRPAVKIRQTASPAARLKLSLDTFVVGPSNQLAYNAAMTVAREEKSPFNPLFIHGGYGVGKTHLLQGICDAVCRSRPKTGWLYLSAEDFTNQFILALKTKKLEAFRSRMRRTELLAIDDIHFLASKSATQEEFLHTFNSVDLAGKQIILASDAHPKMISQLSETLVSRFVCGMVVKIEPPDFQTRSEICRRYAQSMNKQIPEPVIKYIAENLRSNVRELEGALIKLVAFSSLQNEKIDVNMAKQILCDNLTKTDPIVQISDIESAVSAHFGITPAMLHSAKKDRTITIARHFSMYLARKYTKMSFPEVGRHMGNKNHATVLLACRKVEEQIANNTELRWYGQNGNKISTAKAILTGLEETIAY